MRGSYPRGAPVLKIASEEVVDYSPSTFMEFDETTMSARLGHPCDETAVAVLLGTGTLSPLIHQSRKQGGGLSFGVPSNTATAVPSQG